MLFAIFLYAFTIAATLIVFGRSPQSASQPAPKIDVDPHVVTSVQQPTFTDSIVPFARPLRSLGIRQLRLMARDRGLKRYSQYTKPQLLEYLQAS